MRLSVSAASATSSSSDAAASSRASPEAASGAAAAAAAAAVAAASRSALTRARRFAAAMAALVLLGSRFAPGRRRPSVVRGPLARAGLAPSSAGAVVLAGAGVTVPSSASKSASKSASPPMLPISSMTYVPLEGVVTTTPACLNTDMVFFQGSDWPAMTRGCRRKGGEG